MTAAERVAVVGVPRSGTSVAVGLLRILGYGLSERHVPVCRYGEHRLLRGAGFWPRSLAALPPGTVWKDPAVGAYADRVPWEAFDAVVSVTLPDPLGAVRSEMRHRSGVKADVVLARNARWRRSIAEEFAARGITPAARLTLRSVREHGGAEAALSRLAAAVRGDEPSAGELAAARAFVAPLGGYGCPRPQDCPLHGD